MSRWKHSVYSPNSRRASACERTPFNLRQRPDYAPIRFAGHEAGDFVFVPRN